jgi:phenylalanyl-tRNA synthetase beta chain
MPTIDVSLADLSALAGKELSAAELEGHLALVKGELKRGSNGDDLRIELQDTNRPDLWCTEGIARQIRQKLAEPASWRPGYAFLERPGAIAGRIEVDASVADVRPFVAGFLAQGWEVDDAGLRAFIQAQETLARNFGRKRQSIAIGIYDGARIALPVRYEAVKRDDRARAFVPLPPAGDPPSDVPPTRWREAWTPEEILRDHPTGREYRSALSGDLAPLLIDGKGEVLSFPPIINSASLGRVVPGMSVLFVEVTGTVLDHVLLATNILAANLRDRGADVLPLATRYPFDTPRGREIVAPHPLPEKRALALPLERFRALLGEPGLGVDEVREGLLSYGLDVRLEGEGDYLRVEAPPYRCDYLHDVDAVEDFAISRGYGSFAPLMPEEFTVGRLAASTDLADRARDRMIGYGFEEAIANILTDAAKVREAMNLDDHPGLPPLHGGPLVRIANVMNLSYSCLRDWILPSLLEVESRSSGAAYPHRVFEVGEVAVADSSAPLHSRTDLRVAALIAHEAASFSEVQGYLGTLLFHLGLRRVGAGSGGSPYELVATEHPSFLPGRFATILRAGQSAPIGFLGELHPEVLAGAKGLGIRVPCAGFELSLESFRSGEG